MVFADESADQDEAGKSSCSKSKNGIWSSRLAELRVSCSCQFSKGPPNPPNPAEPSRFVKDDEKAFAAQSDDQEEAGKQSCSKSKNKK